MQIPNYLKTTSFRLSSIYALLFISSTALMFLILYWTTINTMKDRIRISIEQQFEQIAELSSDHTVQSLNQAITLHIKPLVSGNLFFKLENSKGQKIAGNLPASLHFTGWRVFSVHEWLTNPSEEDKWLLQEPDSHKLLALQKKLDSGWTLTVGEDLFWLNEVEEQWFGAFIWSVGIVILIALFGGILMSRGVLHRIDNINQSIKTIINGKLETRLPRSKNQDELDLLSANVNAMLDRINILMEDLQQVTNNIAHDLRTPLNRVRQRLESAITESNTLEECQQQVGESLIDIDHSLSIFSALLSIAQIESGTPKARFVPVDLSNLLMQLEMTYSPVAEDMGKMLKFKLDKHVTINGDRSLLAQLFVNLIENALRHTPDRSQIQIILDKKQGKIIISDNGKGIPKEARNKIFERFYRMDSSRSTEGHGMGLAMVEAIASLHEFSILVEDNQPGLKISLEFTPLTRQETPPDQRDLT